MGNLLESKIRGFEEIEKDINGSLEHIDFKVRDWCESQRSLWQKVPYLCLMADGRAGFQDRYNLAYTHGLWTLSDIQYQGYYQVFVECYTGYLVNGNHSFRHLVSKTGEADEFVMLRRDMEADPEYVLQIAQDLSMIDARAIIGQLKKEGKKPFFSNHFSEGWQERVDELKDKLDLGETYIRRRGFSFSP